jgi:uncharacterized protein (TIGR03083 family)
VHNGAAVDLGRLYREARERVTALVSGLDAAELGIWVPTCPAWTVQDVVGHLVAIPEDVLAGHLAGVPSDDFTAGQVARFAGVPVADRLARWAVAAPQFEELVSAFQVWPALIDVASHEQDIRSATGRPGERDSAAIRECTHMLMSWLEVPVPLRTVTEDGEYRAGPPGKPDHAGQVDHTELVLTTTRFEAFRWRMGRRSRAQLAALAWSADPAAVLDHLAIFGPAASDIVE